MKVPFPQFEMLYTIDYDNDIIKRGNGTVINETNSTVVEKTLLHLFQAIIKEADDYDASLDEVLDGYRAEMLED
jgi:non-homologous end joining protein Ku